MKAIAIVFRILCASILLLAVVEIAWMKPSRGADEAPAKTEEPKTVETEKPALENVPQELQHRVSELEGKQRELAEQDTRLKEREKEIDRKLKQMEDLRAAVSGELEGQKKNNEERVLKMVSVFETMSPKSASGVLETLDDWLAVEVLKRMDIKKVAKVMNIMDKARSAKLSEMLTGYYKPRDSVAQRASSDSQNNRVPAAAGQEGKSNPTTPPSISKSGAPNAPPQKGETKIKNGK
jgi:flagellar motility protein MotE (MotC chaperone)